MILNDKQPLQHDQIKQLRQQQLIGESEFPYIAGDLLVAENIETGEKRVIGNANDLLTENKKRVLLG